MWRAVLCVLTCISALWLVLREKLTNQSADIQVLLIILNLLFYVPFHFIYCYINNLLLRFYLYHWDSLNGRKIILIMKAIFCFPDNRQNVLSKSFRKDIRNDFVFLTNFILKIILEPFEVISCKNLWYIITIFRVILHEFWLKGTWNNLGNDFYDILAKVHKSMRDTIFQVVAVWLSII